MKVLDREIVLKNVLSLRGAVCNSVLAYVVYRHVLNHNGDLLVTWLQLELVLTGLEGGEGGSPLFSDYFI